MGVQDTVDLQKRCIASSRVACLPAYCPQCFTLMQATLHTMANAKMGRAPCLRFATARYLALWVSTLVLATSAAPTRK